jgi:hypothetical protein
MQASARVLVSQHFFATISRLWLVKDDDIAAPAQQYEVYLWSFHYQHYTPSNQKQRDQFLLASGFAIVFNLCFGDKAGSLCASSSLSIISETFRILNSLLPLLHDLA